jgi:alkylhydroperoxidase family enzyme
VPKLDDATRCTPRERAALEFADRLAGAHTTIDDAFMAGLRAHFDEAEIVELGFVTGAFLMLGRLHRAFGVAAMSAATHELFAHGV